jgi:hypothetical protein
VYTGVVWIKPYAVCMARRVRGSRVVPLTLKVSRCRLALGFFFRGACLEGLTEPTSKKLCLHNTLGLGIIDWCLFSEPGSAI